MHNITMHTQITTNKLGPWGGGPSCLGPPPPLLCSFFLYQVLPVRNDHYTVGKRERPLGNTINWVSVSPKKFIRGNPHPQCDNIWRMSPWKVLRVRGGHVGKALKMQCPNKKGQQSSLSISYVRTQPAPGHLQAWKRAFTSLTPLAPRSWIYSLRNYEERSVCRLRYRACDILSRQPQQTHTESNNSFWTKKQFRQKAFKLYSETSWLWELFKARI